MQIKIIAISKLQSKEIEVLINEYIKRISKFSKVEFVEFKKEIKISEIKDKYKSSYLILLDENGKEYNSQQFAAELDKLNTYTNSQIAFVIGDSDGFSAADLALADETISLSKMTMPHELALLALTEQIYRGLTILNNHPYHRG